MQVGVTRQATGAAIAIRGNYICRGGLNPDAPPTEDAATPLQHARPFLMAALPVASIRAPLSPGATSGRWPWASATEQASGNATPWILDVDLDYFVDDLEAPKMRGPPDVSLNHTVAQLNTRFYGKRVHALRRWLCGRLPYPLCASYFSFEGYIAQPPNPMRPAVFAQRLEELAKVLRLLPAPPCLVTVARSNVGGYTPIANTTVLENSLVDLVQRTFFGANPAAVRYVPWEALNASDLAEFVRRWNLAHRTKRAG